MRLQKYTFHQYYFWIAFKTSTYMLAAPFFFFQKHQHLFQFHKQTRIRQIQQTVCKYLLKFTQAFILFLPL